MEWRIYRLPGSRLIWHVDTGPNTQIVNVRGFEIYVPCISVDDETKHPRAWIEIPSVPVNEDYTAAKLHIIDGIAIWSADPTRELIKRASEQCAAEVAAPSA